MKYITYRNQTPFLVDKLVLERDFEMEQASVESSSHLSSAVYLVIDYDDADHRLRRDTGIPQSWFVYGFVNMDLLVSKRHLWNVLSKAYARATLLEFLPESYTDWTTLPDEYTLQERWVLKKDIQQQKGITLVQGDPRPYIEPDTRVVQRFVDQPLLWDGYKVNFRVYVGVLARPIEGLFEVFYYRDGFIYYTPDKYETGSYITTGYTDRKIYERNPLTVQDLLKAIPATQAEVLERNISQCVRVVFKPYRHILRAKWQRTFQLFGMDVHPKSNGQVLVMEVNKSPDLNTHDEADATVKLDMVQGFWTKVLTGHLATNWTQVQV